MICEYFQVTGANELALDYSDLLRITLMATTLRIMTPDGMKFYNQSVKFPMAVFWKVCIRCEYDQEINQHLAAELSEVEDRGDEMHG